LPKEKKEKLESFRRKCRVHHLSMTPQRMAIYEVLIGSEDHPTTEEVFERVRVSFPDISIDTVYRTLTTFSDMGLIHVVEGYGEAKRYDPDMAAHHHFRCRKCHKIIDFQEPGFDKLHIPDVIGEKCEVSTVKVILEGLCDGCLLRQKTAGGICNA
jgi:Fur family peroxide stress response transcriptional regulator